MRISWWQSIRWRMALASVGIVLLATMLLALTTILAVRYYYVAEQQSRLGGIALDKSRTIGADYALLQQNSQTGTPTQAAWLRQASINSMKDATGTSADTYLYMVLDTSRHLEYPYPSNTNRTSAPAAIAHFIDPGVTAQDQRKIAVAIQKAFRGQSSANQLGRAISVASAQPFVVVPIYNGGLNLGQDKPIGIIIATTLTAKIPPFVSTVGIAIAVATLVIVILAAVVAIMFAGSITRPLRMLTNASRVLATGNYGTQVPTDAPGEIGELSHTFNDMAAHLKRDVEELRQQEQWRRELIMNVTHDLATPLTAIAGLGEALVDGVNQSREDYEATGRIIVRETLRLRRLVQDLHMMAKVTDGAIQLRKSPVRLATLVDQTLATMITEFERHRVEPINEIPYNLPTIEADADMLTRIFANLWSNALRHTPTNGTITISAQVKDSNVQVSVIDTGEGIPEEALSRIFDRFYRADSARQSTTGGSGLGLAIVQALVEAHGGNVWATNIPGGGACISFTLPTQTDELSSATTAPLPQKTEM